MKNVVITGFSNPSSEGVVLHLNRKSTLKSGNIPASEFYVGWDKIGKALFEDYCDSDDLDTFKKLRSKINEV